MNNQSNSILDPLFSLQWHLSNPTTSGIWGVNAIDIWQDYTGKGVSVSVIDSGVDPHHPDLKNNYDYSNQFNSTTGEKGVITSENGETFNSGAPNTGDAHGTAVAGLIAAERNGIGVVGVAYESTIVPILLDFDIDQSDLASRIARSFAHGAKFDIVNNSWGYRGIFSDNFQDPEFGDVVTELEKAISDGRDGLGTIFVFSAGNSGLTGNNVNLQNFQNSRYSVTVAATQMSGQIFEYSTPGAAVTVSAPSSGITANLVTTDIVGKDGYSSLGDYGFFSGTSGAAPIVSGVVALMLEANPNLGWRDVQEILVYGAVKSDPASKSWQKNGAKNWNGAGVTVSHNFGGGLVDAHASVRLAETWQTQHTTENEEVFSVSSTDSLSLVIPDNNKTGISSSVNVDSGLEIDYVELELDISHNFVGDLEVTLTSPDGTTSKLLNRPGLGLTSDVGSEQDNAKFVFGSTQHWGETGVGEWTVNVKDLKTGDLGQLNNYTLRLYGDKITEDNTYIYTNELAVVGSDATRQILSDKTGVDTINAAAVTTDSLINLTPGSLSTIASINTQIAPDTTIENVLSGDGNDTLTGNDQNNVIGGGRGKNVLTGGDGPDTFVFSFLSGSLNRITDFDHTEQDSIQINSDRFGATSLDQFSFNSDNGSLSFKGEKFVTLENIDNTDGFSVNRDIVIV